MRPRIGLSVMLLESRREAILELATEGDRLGYDGFMPTVVADTGPKAREGAAWFVSFFATTSTVYRDSLMRQGYGKAVEAVLAANASRFTGNVPAGADELLEQLVVYGTPSEARQRLERWHEAGADFPVLLLRPNLTAEERGVVLEAFRPMLRSTADDPYAETAAVPPTGHGTEVAKRADETGRG
jgi:hypothetical protein